MPGLASFIGGVVSTVGRQILANNLEIKSRPLIEKAINKLEDLGKETFKAGRRFAEKRVANTKELFGEIKEFKTSMLAYEGHLAESHPKSAAKQRAEMRDWLGEFIDNHKNVATSLIGNVYQEMIDFRRMLQDQFDKSEPEAYKPRKMTGKQLQELDKARESAETIQTHLNDSRMPMHFKLMLASKMRERLVDSIAKQVVMEAA